MNVRTESIIDRRRIAKTTSLLAQFPELAMFRINGAFGREIVPQLSNELRRYPGAAKNGLNSSTPFVWSDDPKANARARRWFFAHYPEGYTRTGAFGRAWKVTVLYKPSDIRLSVENPTPGTRFIVGNLRTGKGQIPGHLNSNWELAAPKIEFARKQARAVARTTIGNLIREVFGK